MARHTDIRLRRSAVSGNQPGVSDLNLGELAINTADGKVYMKKSVGGTDSIVEVGAGGGIAASFTAYEYTATSSQTTFSGSDSYSNTLAYNTGTPPKVQVFMNGILLDEGSSADYTGTNGTSVVLTTAADAGDLIQIHAYKSDVSIVSNLAFLDNQKLQFGDSQDLQIYHDGNNSYITDTGTGDLKIGGANIAITTAGGTKYFEGASNRAFLFHTGNQKLVTTAIGIDVTGNVVADGLNVSTGIYNINTSGASLISSTGSVKIDIDSDNNATDNRFLITSDGNTKNRLEVGEDGDISFYEDTGSTPKFFWDASAEALGLGTTAPSASYSIDAVKGIRSSGAAPNFTLQETDTGNQTWLMASYGGVFSIRDTTVSGSSYPFRIDAATPTNTLHLNATGIDVTGTGSMINTTAGVATALALYNNTAGANNRTSIDFYTASTKYGTIEGGYGASAPEMNFKVGNAPAQILKLTSTGIDVTGNIGVTGTVDGIDIAARDAVLTSTTTTAGAALPKAGGTLTGLVQSNSTIQTTANIKVGGYLLFDGNDDFTGSDYYTIQDDVSTDVLRIGRNFNTTDCLELNSTGDLHLKGGNLTVSGNIIVGGTVDGRDVATDGTKLDTIETSATADQTQAEINALGITATGLSGTPNIGVGTISSGNITTTGYLRGPSTFTIDPAAHGDDTGTLVIAGNLQVDGTTTTINSTTVSIDDLNFTIASDAADSAAAHGAGITIGGAGTIFAWSNTLGSMTLNKELRLDNNKGLFFANAAGNATVGLKADTSDNITFRQNGSWDRLVIKNTGVDVSGNIVVTGTVDGVDIAARDAVLTSTTTTAGAALPKAGGTMTGNLVMSNTSPQLQFQTGSSHYNWQIAAQENVSNALEISSGSADADATNDTYTPRVVVLSSGNVGIGTSSPTRNLTVKAGSGQEGIELIDADESLFLIQKSGSSTNTSYVSMLSEGNTTVRLHADNVSYFNGGNVGIGTASPASHLHVKGSTNKTIIADSTFSSGSFTTLAFQRNGADKWRITQQADDSHLSFYNDQTSTYQLSLKSNGNVGIGTSNPQDTLHVVTDSATTNDTVDVVRIEATSSGTPVAGFGPAIEFRAERGNASADSVGRLGFVADNITASRVDGAFVAETAIDGAFTERLRISSSGNVGIGTDYSNSINYMLLVILELITVAH